MKNSLEIFINLPAIPHTLATVTHWTNFYHFQTSDSTHFLQISLQLHTLALMWRRSRHIIDHSCSLWMRSHSRTFGFVDNAPLLLFACIWQLQSVLLYFCCSLLGVAHVATISAIITLQQRYLWWVLWLCVCHKKCAIKWNRIKSKRSKSDQRRLRAKMAAITVCTAINGIYYVDIYMYIYYVERDLRVYKWIWVFLWE